MVSLESCKSQGKWDLVRISRESELFEFELPGSTVVNSFSVLQTAF